MTFNPQYGLWSKDPLSTSGQAIYENPGEFEIRGGVTKLVPIDFNSGTFAFNAPWDHVSGWSINSTMDSELIVTGDFFIYTEDPTSSTFGNIGTSYNSAFFTSGEQSCFVLGLGDGGMPENATIEIDVRTLSTGISGSLNSTGDAPFYHTITFVDTNVSPKYGLVEIRPDGIRIPTVSGAVIPGDYNSALRTIRIIKAGDDIILMSQHDESVLYVNDAMTPCLISGDHDSVDDYIAFGSYPITGNEILYGSQAAEYFVHYTGLNPAPSGFQGMTLWDDVKITTTESVTIRPNDFFPNYPEGEKVLHTAPWYPATNMYAYKGAFISIVGTSGGITTIKPEYLTTGLSGNTEWVTSDTEALVFSEHRSDTYYMDLSTVPVEGYPFQNALKFEITSESITGQVPEIDTITVIGASDSHKGIINPNWKLSSMPKVLAVSPDYAAHDKYIPVAHPQDVYFLHNKAEEDRIPLSGVVPAAQEGLLSGVVMSLGGGVMFNYEPSGLAKIDDGVYGPAWRNFNQVNYTGSGGYMSASGEYIATWSSMNTNNVYSTGDGGIFQGNLLATYDIYPSGGMPLTSGQHGVLYSIYDYQDFDGSIKKAQRVVVEGYNKNTTNSSYYETWAGIRMADMAIPLKEDAPARQMGFIEGVIQIPRGPGVTVCLHEENLESTVFLRGEDFRTPRKFGCATTYVKTSHLTDNWGTWASFGCLPRNSKPSFDNKEEYGDWSSLLDRERTDEFILYNVTGYMIDHSWIEYSGYNSRVARKGRGISGSPEMVVLWATGNTNPSGTYGTVKELNEFFDDEGFTESYVPPERNSLLVEGWFRPYGFKSHDGVFSSGELLYLKDEHATNQRGFSVHLHRDGHVTASVDTESHVSCYGLPGNSSATTSIKNHLSSEEHRIIWGDWNHIGVCMECAPIGDGEYHSSYPAAAIDPNSNNVLHGARSSKIYLTLNGKIVDQVDDGKATYTKLFLRDAGIAPSIGYPSGDQVIDSMPLIREFAGRSGVYEGKIAENIFCDFDHVRVSIRDRTDVLTDIFTLGSKDTPGLLSHKNAPKPMMPIASGVSHWELAHIYRFDKQLDKYNLLDDGFAPGHALLYGYTTGDTSYELVPFGIDPSKFTAIVDGPDERPALRIGPGARVDIPWNSFDERIFNGTGSMEFNQELITTGTTDYTEYVETRGYAYSRQTSNSAFRMGGRFKLHKYPSSGIMDLCTLDEYSEPELYGKRQAYLGINTNGVVQFGTRYDYDTSYEIGPLSGEEGPIELNTWYHLGIDMSLRENFSINTSDTNTWTYWFNGVSGYTNSGIICVANGHTASHVGRPMAYAGLQGSGNGENYSIFRVGGDIPRSGNLYDWTYRYGDFSVQDFVIGYSLTTTGSKEGDISQWSWSGLASIGQKAGFDEVMVANGNVIATISGGPITGNAYYPATLYEDAGEQFVYFTANRGNDYAGLLERGISLYPDSPFTNAASYYVVYQEDNIRDIIGSTDSPIQIGTVVPKEGINLAMVNISTWDVDKSIVTFDMSDKNYSNITPRVLGDSYLSLETVSGGMQKDRAVLTEDIRVSSIPVYSDSNSISDIGYFMYQIGDDKKGIYIKNAYDHDVASGNTWFKNIDKIQNAISLKDSNGNSLDFSLFPYRLISSTSFNGTSLKDKTFAVTLIANKQSINSSVFIHYPSIDYSNGTINLQDSEIFNPIPVMKRNPRPSFVQTSGEFSTSLSLTHKRYDLTVWGGTTGDLSTDNQSSL